MRRMIMVLGIAAIVAGMASTTFAGDFKLVISIGRALLCPPPPAVVYQPPPVVCRQPQVVYQQAPVACQPTVVYQQAPVVYPRQQVIYQPAPVVAAPVCRGGSERDRFDRDRDRGLIRSGHYIYQPVRCADGSVWYRQIWTNN